MAEDAIFTIGYEKAKPEEFVAALTRAGVSLVLDVRDKAWSRRPDYIGRRLAARLEAAGIAYRWMPELGTPEAGRKAAKSGDMDGWRRSLDDRLAGAEGQAALAHAAALAGERSAALLCLEADPARCHRSIVAERLAELTALPVRHLRAAGQGDLAL
jgi:uncharacterized protein (DUF488 family)